MQGRGILWILGRIQLTEQFDEVMVMESGKLIDKGTFTEMKNSNEHFQQLLAAE